MLDKINTDVLGLEVLPLCCTGITDLSGMRSFTGLVELRANNNAITTVSELPPNLEILNLRLNSLPALPNTLEIITVASNQWISLPTLPQSLKELDRTANLIQTLPTLPLALEDL